MFCCTLQRHKSISIFHAWFFFLACVCSPLTSFHALIFLSLKYCTAPSATRLRRISPDARRSSQSLVGSNRGEDMTAAYCQVWNISRTIHVNKSPKARKWDEFVVTIWQSKMFWPASAVNSCCKWGNYPDKIISTVKILKEFDIPIPN